MNDIEQRRIKAGLTQEQLAERVGCSQTTIARIEKGAKSRPVLLKVIDSVLDSGKCVTHANGEQINRGASEPPPLDLAAALREATAALHEKLDLQAMLIESQRQTIDALRETVDALRRGNCHHAEAPPGHTAPIANGGGKRQPA